MSLEMSRVTHRKWSWADEQGWVGVISLPYSTSDGWTKYAGSPILDASRSGDWENEWVQHGCVVRKDGVYYLFYHGWRVHGAKADPSVNPNQGIGLATSSLPTGPYTRDPNNPLVLCGALGAWDDYDIGNPVVIYDGIDDKWKMWYRARPTSGLTHELGYATADSPEGPWTKSGSNPVWDGGVYGVGLGHTVLRIGNLFYMFYPISAMDRIRVATSSDGIAWTDWGQVLATGSGWESADVRYVGVLFNQGVWNMFYSGYDGSNFQIGLATSYSAFRTFDKWPLNPVLGIGGEGDFDKLFAFAPWVLMLEDTFWMWYTGKDSSSYRGIGLASIP